MTSALSSGSPRNSRGASSIITTEQVSFRDATVRVTGVFDETALFVAEQVIRGHRARGRRYVYLDLSTVTRADPAALAAVEDFGIDLCRQDGVVGTHGHRRRMS